MRAGSPVPFPLRAWPWPPWGRRIRGGLGTLLALDASFVAKSGDATWGTGWFWSGMARAARWGLEVTLLAAVDVEEGGAYPLGARQSPGAVRARRQTCGADTGRETAGETALALLGEAVAPGAREILGARWVAVEGVRALDLHTVGRLRKDAVLRFPYTGPHERRPGRKKQFDGGFDRRDPARLARITLKKAKVDLYHGRLHSKAWQCWLHVVYVLPRGADPETKEGVLLYSTDTELEPERIFHFYGARFQIEFAFRDAKQHLGLNHGQTRSQARQHFHFNLVFAALFWARLQARLRAERPLGPFSLRNLKSRNLGEEIHKRIAAGSATGRNASNSGAGGRRIPPERLWLRAPPPATGPAGP